MRWSRSRSRLRTSSRLRPSTGTRRRTRGFRGALGPGLQEDPGRPVVLELVMTLSGTLGTVDPGLVAFEQVLDLRPQSLGDHAEQANRWTRLAHLHLVQEGAAEVVAHDLGEAHAAVLADPPDPLTQRLGLLDRPGVLVHVKGQFTDSREGRGCG